MSYHTINEEAARRANDMNSFRDYKAGSATAEYRRMVDAATELAERQKQRVDPMYSMRNYRNANKLQDIYDMWRSDALICIVKTKKGAAKK